ncbi:MAG: peptidoglycan DD-metalloendopeptidase family protein [Clostridiales bacterium]|nr:peptidoglycan DD-metalloendopeptidase family protein [Clostridiales bacterium]
MLDADPKTLQEHSDTDKYNDNIQSVYRFLYRMVSYIGFEVLKVIKYIYDAERKLSLYIEKKLTPLLTKLVKRIPSVFHAALLSVSRPFRKAAKGIRLIRHNVSEARKVDFRSAVDAFFSTLWQGLRNNGWFFKTLLNYLAPAVGVVLLCLTVQYFSGLTIAVSVSLDGNHIGYVSDETVYNQAAKMFQQRIVYEDNAEKIDTHPLFSVEITDTAKVLNEDQVVDSMIRMSDQDIVQAGGIYIDHKFYGAVTETEAINAAMEEMLAKHRTGKPNETVQFVKPIEIKKGLYLTSTVKHQQEIVDLLHSEVAGEVTYTVEQGDTPSGVAKKNNIPYSEFKAMNPNCETKFLVGQKMYLAKSEPFLAVEVVLRETYKTETMYATETVKDNTKSISYRKVTQAGVKGITEYTADIHYINGVETARDILSSKVLQTVVNQKEVVGNKVYSESYSSPVTSSGNGSLSGLNFVDPIRGGKVTTRFKASHRALDIAITNGTPIHAAEAGTVVLARYYGSYGNCIIIDHGNNVQTLYAHAERLKAKVGQSVAKGEVISWVGHTGRVYGRTGNHLHFEIRSNGKQLNPAKYIGR